MQRSSHSFRNRLMLACALVMAGVLVVPSAFARGHYGHHGNRTADTLGALIVGAVIGGVIVSATDHHHHNDYRGGYYYPAPPYASYNYGYAYPRYAPTYSGYAYPGYGYGSRVNVGVVYSSRGGYYGHSRTPYRRGYNGYRGYRGGNRQTHSYVRRGHRGHAGSYYHRGRR